MKQQDDLHGLLVIDKPNGPTSHDVVWRLRKTLHQRSIGHAGTLDPMATGVLLCLVGEGTKLVQFLTLENKRYEADVALGVATDTLDAEGAVTAPSPPPGYRVSGENERAFSLGPMSGPGCGTAAPRRFPCVLRH
jgi:tRNA pseudouridine55 synthase